MIRIAAIALLMTTLVGCDPPRERLTEPYEASFIATLGEVGDNSDAQTQVRIMASDRFWTEHVRRFLYPTYSANVVRAGMSITIKRRFAIDGMNACEYVVRLEHGGEQAFDAICHAFTSYSTDAFIRRLSRSDVREFYIPAIRKAESPELREQIARRMFETLSAIPPLTSIRGVTKPNKAPEPTP